MRKPPCQHCGATVSSGRSTKSYCSGKCRQASYRNRTKSQLVLQQGYQQPKKHIFHREVDEGSEVSFSSIERLLGLIVKKQIGYGSKAKQIADDLAEGWRRQLQEALEQSNQPE